MEARLKIWVMTASFGIAGCSGKDSPGFTSRVRKADQMLYEAKRGRRNTVCVFYPQV